MCVFVSMHRLASSCPWKYLIGRIVAVVRLGERCNGVGVDTQHKVLDVERVRAPRIQRIGIVVASDAVDISGRGKLGGAGKYGRRRCGRCRRR